jgi:hypothetical protein
MRRSRAWLVFLLSPLALLAAGCSSSGSGSNSAGGGGGATAPQIAAQPHDATVTVGQMATFSVTATGTGPFTYQWRKNMTAISGATSSSYTTPATASGDDGTKFDVIVSNAAGSTTSSEATLTVKPSSATLQSIAVTPPSPSIPAGTTQQFKATGTYSDNSMSDITATVTWASSVKSFATISTSGLATGVSAGTTQITATLGTVFSPNDPLTVTAATASTVDVVTHHYDGFRSGANLNETILTTSNVNSTTFGKVAEFSVDGQIDGQILYLSQLAIPGQGNKNILYFATENDSVYAVDADTMSGSSATVLWKTTVRPSNEITLTPSDAGCGYINPVGVISTPVIDRGRNAIYVLSASKDGNGNVHHRMYALNLTDGSILFGPTLVAATYPGKGGNSNGTTVTFLDKVQQNRTALLESGGLIYTAWSGYDGDCGNYSAWVIAFDAGTLAQVGAIDLVPNSSGAGIWMGGGGPAADAAGNVYVATGNAFGGNTPGITNDYGDTFVKLAPGTPLAVTDYFAPSIAIQDDNSDEDLGSAGPLLLPDLTDSNNITQHLAVIAGKDHRIYIANRDNMGHYNAMADDIYQELPGNGDENFSSPAYFNARMYIGPAGSPLQAFAVSKAMLSSSPASQSSHIFNGAGTVPSVSANGTSNGIVWALDGGGRTLYAYDATDLTKVLYTSAQTSGGRDSFAIVGGHFITPMVANGRVYFGTGSTVAVFGLLP